MKILKIVSTKFRIGNTYHVNIQKIILKVYGCSIKINVNIKIDWNIRH